MIFGRMLKSPDVVVAIVATVAFLAPTMASEKVPAQSDTPAADLMVGNESGQVRDDNDPKMKFVWCSPGLFAIESFERRAVAVVEKAPLSDDDAEEQPVRDAEDIETFTPTKAFLTRGYWLGKYEVTQAEWKHVMGVGPWTDDAYIQFVKIGDDFPAAYVTWKNAMKFCQTLTERERAAGRLPPSWEYALPTEAQWVRACRARTETQFSFGDDKSNLGAYAWFDASAWLIGEPFAHRVGQKKPNPWGLYDMYGNVSEWCRDEYSEKPRGGRDPEFRSLGSRPVCRGGGYLSDASSCRAGRDVPELAAPDIGFRVGLVPIRAEKPVTK